MNRLSHIEERLFTEERLCLFGLGGISVFVFVLAWHVFYILPSSRLGWPFLPNGTPTCIDFGFFWLTGKLAVAGDTAQIFDFSSWQAVQAAFFDPRNEAHNCINYNRFVYPPTLLFFTYPLGLMPYSVALGVWIITTFGLYLAAIYAIIPRRTALIGAATLVWVMFSNFFMGHNGFLTAALIGLSLAVLERRPWLSGIFLGLLTYKPHFGLLFPIALLASRNWRAISSAVIATGILAILAAMAFGYEGWLEFITAITNRNSGLGPAPEVEMRLQSIFGLSQLVGALGWLSWIAQLSVSAVVAIAIWVLWAKPVSYNLKAAAVCTGLLLASPYVLFYDLPILAIAVVYFVKEGLLRGFLPGERVAILICWFTLLLPTMRSGPVIYAILLFLITRRVTGSRRPAVGCPVHNAAREISSAQSASSLQRTWS